MRLPALLAALALLLAGCVTTSTPPQGLPGAAPFFERLLTHAEVVERLASLEAAGARVEPIGQSVEGRAMHLVTVGHGDFELWLAARHHGNEPTSTEAVLNVIDYLLGRKEPGEGALPVTRELWAHRAELLGRVTFVVVPMANPDGADAYRRTNANGQDLNRDYLLFTEPESRNVRDAFWRAWPDAGLDLHNEGLDPEAGGYDYDAFYPEVPRAEEDTQALSLANQWTVVHELEASGAYAGGPNENYVTGSLDDPCEYSDRYVPEPLPNSIPLAPPTDDTEPTAYCEGTHDAFLTLRGAPGWTPEAAVAWDQAESPTLPWGIRLHEATIASTAFLYAGAYAGCVPRVQKFAGSLQGTTTVPVLTEAERARFQVVWREDLTGYDQHAEEVDLQVRTPSGQVLGPEAHPAGYAETVWSAEAGAHAVTLAARSPVPTPYELRAYECLPVLPGLGVQRADGGLRVANAGPAPLDVQVEDSLVGAHAARAEGAAVRVVQGNLAPKTVLAWSLRLGPGEERLLAYELPAGASPGPARWHAHGPSGEMALGATDERGSPAPPSGDR